MLSKTTKPTRLEILIEKAQKQLGITPTSLVKKRNKKKAV